MKRFSNVLKDLDYDKIREESDASNLTKKLPYLNGVFKANYPKLQIGEKFKNNIILVWNKVLTYAPKKISGNWITLFGSIDKLINTIYSNKKTAEAIFTELRQAVKTKYGANSELYKQSIYKTGITQEESLKRKADYKEKVNERNLNRGNLTPLFIEDVLSLIRILRESSDPYEVLLLTLLTSGCRSIEILRISKFEEIPGKPEEMKITGLGKGNKDSIFTRNLIGLDAKEFIKHVEFIRENIYLGEKNNIEIATLINTRLNKKFKSEVVPLLTKNGAKEDELKKFTSHKTRYIYAGINYELNGKPKNIPFESFIQSQLNHSSGESTKSYLAINLKWLHDKNDKQEQIQKNNDIIHKELKQEIDEINLKQVLFESGEPVIDGIDFKKYSNTFSRKETTEMKINKVVEVLGLLKRSGIKMTQKELQGRLHFSSGVMTAAYKAYRNI